MSVTLTCSGTNSVIDSSSGAIAFQKGLSAAFVGSVFSEAQTVTVSTSPVSIALPISPTQFVYIKNVTATNNTLIVTWTPNGGASNPVVTLEPGSFIQFVEATTGAGITALTVTGSAPGTLAEYILGG